MSYSNYLEDAINNAVGNNAALAIAQCYLKLHIGDPGEDCTGAPAADTRRVAVSFGASASGTMLNDAVAEWLAMTAAETVSHASLWDDATAGNPLMYGALAAPKTVGVGDDLDFAVGEIAFTSS